MEVTIEITNYCPNNCDYCSTDAGEDKLQHLSIIDIKVFLDDSVKMCGGDEINRLNISGGEPLAHPEFYKILELCKVFTKNIWVYTNAITQIIYNTDIIKEIKVEANACLVPGRDVYIPENADKVHLLQLVPQGRAKNMKPAKFHVSGNIIGEHKCAECNHKLLQANGKIVSAPCKKDYGCGSKR